MQLFRTKVNQIWTPSLLVGAALALAVFVTFIAQVYAQTAQTVEITDLEILDAKTDEIESVFPKGAKIQIEALFTDLRNLTAYDDDDPDFDQDYVVVFEVQDDNDRVIYSSDELLTGNTDLQLEPEERKRITFRWNAPFDADQGSHKIIITVRDANNFSNIQDVEKSTIIIQNSAAALFVSESSIDFGDVEDDDTPQARIIIANPNRAAGDLVWKIVKLPDWLEFITPEASENDSQESVVMTNNHTIILQVRSTVLKGTLSDKVKIESNAGTSTIDVSVSVDRNANGLISRLKTQSSLYKPGDEVSFLYRVKNDGAVTMTYSVSFLVRAPTGSLYFNTNSEGLDAVVGPLDSGDETNGLVFTWTIPFGTLPGDYELGAQLRGYRAFEFLFDDVPFPSKAAKSGPPVRDDELTDGDTFEVRKGALISVKPAHWAFGAIMEGESEGASFDVSNTGRGTLEWTVVSWPEWLELESPIGPVSGRDRIEVRISESAPPGSLAGTIDIESNGGLKSIKVSARVLALPTPTVGIATVLARLIPTATPAPTATPRPIPSATPTPAPLEAMVLSGRINIRNGGVFPDDAKLVAKIGDHISPPAAVDGGSYSSLVVIPTDRSDIGKTIEFYLGDARATLTTPLIYFQGGAIRLDLTFSAMPTATAVPRPEPTPTVPAPVDTPVAAAVLPVSQATATATIQAQESTPEPTQTTTPQVFITAESGDTPSSPTAGGCNATAAHVGWTTGLLNTALLIMPIGMVVGLRWNRRRRIH